MNSPVRHQDSALRSTSLPHVLAMPTPEAVALDLSAVLIAVRADEPVVAVVPTAAAGASSAGDARALPCGPYSPSAHATLEAALRTCVARQTGVAFGSAQPLCTFGVSMAGAAAPGLAAELPVVSLCFLALVTPRQHADGTGADWQSWYTYFPWEDWRRGKPASLAIDIEPRLRAWCDAGRAYAQSMAGDRARRVQIAFGGDSASWDEEKVVERYDILCEAGLAGAAGAGLGPRLWHPALGDHARVLACAIAEVRRTVKCRPVVFELMPEVFTLFELQKTVEAILGPHLHKQNFRRLVEGGGLVEPTGEHRMRTGGRPARLYRFRRDVLLERPAPGVRVKMGRA